MHEHELLSGGNQRKLTPPPRESVACVATVSFLFPGGDRISERKSGLLNEHAWGEQKFGEKWGGVSEKGEV